MNKSRDSSVWRSLAVAFGDGLAFGVGVKLTENVPGKLGRPLPSEISSRVAEIERRIARIESAPEAASANLDQGILDALVAALEARLEENAAELDRRLAALDGKVTAELKNLRQQDQALASGTETHVEEIHHEFHQQVVELSHKVSEDRNVLASQVIALHREFAAAVVDIVEEQVASQVDERVADEVSARLAPLEQRLREEIQQASATGRREIADLRQRFAENGRSVLNVLLTIGELFRHAAGWLSAPNPVAAAASSASEGGTASGNGWSAAQESEQDPQAVRTFNDPARIPPRTATAAEAASPYSDSELPAFARPHKAVAVWNIPLVSSFVVTAGCVAVLQYL